MTLFSAEFAIGAWGFMLGFLGIVHGGAYAPIEPPRFPRGVWRTADSRTLGRYKILVVHSVLKPWVPVEASSGALWCSTRRGREKLLVLVIWEIKNNNHKAIISIVLCCALRHRGREGGGVCKWFRGGSLSDDSQVLGRLSWGSPQGGRAGERVGGGGPRLRNCLYFSGKTAIRSRASQC